MFDDALKQLSTVMDTIPAPIYQRVKQAIISQIRSGKWRTHQRIPSETEMVNALGVSRMTINRALRELTSEGYLVRMQGVGTFVAHLKAHSALLEVHNIADEIAQRGNQHHSQVVLLAQAAADEHTAEAFSVAPCAPLFHSQIIHYENDVPVQFEDRYVNPGLAADYLAQDFTRQTPHYYLSHAAPLTAGEHIVEAVLPDARQQRYLALTPTTPCLLIQRRTWHHQQLVTLAYLLYPGDKYHLSGRFTGK